LHNVRGETDWSGLHWVLDTPADYDYLRRIYERAGIRSSHVPGFEAVARLVSGDSALMQLNAKALDFPGRTLAHDANPTI
jgi:hypothetical protein